MDKIDVTVINTNAEVSIEIGDKLRLFQDPNNEYDPKAVKVMKGDVLVGYLAAKPETALPDTMLAGRMFKNLNNPKLAEAWVRITEGNTNRLFTGCRGTCFFVPKVEEEQAPKIETAFVGGANASNPLKIEFLQELVSLSKDKYPTIYLKKDTDRNNRSQVFCMMDNSGGIVLSQSIGTVKEPSDTLLGMLKQGVISAKVTDICNKNGQILSNAEDAWGYMIEYSLAGTNSKEVEAAITQCVRDGKGQISEITEKAEYMIGQGISPGIVCKALEKMAITDLPEMVPCPKVKYMQSDGYGELTRALAYRVSGMNLRLIGNKGSGKNTLAETIDWILGIPQYRLQGNAEMDKLDLLGSPTIKEGNMEYSLSDMLRYLQMGADVVLDEGNTIKPEVADLLHSLTDECKKIEVPMYGLVEMHPLSTITITMNEDYMGTTRMNEATVDRFVPIQMSQPDSIATMLKDCVPTASEKSIKICDQIYVAIKNKIGAADGTEDLEPDCMTIRGFIDALRAEPLLGLKRTLLDNVANKPQDSHSRLQLQEIIESML